jgi:hypothetical protein
MMRKGSWLAALWVVLFAGSASAQSPLPLVLEVRGGLPLATGEFAEVGEDIGDGLGPGYSIGGSATLQFTPTLGAYAGYSFSHFEVREFEKTGTNDKGFDAGLRAVFPTRTGLAPWVKGGLVYHRVSVVYDEEVLGNNVNVTNRELGLEAGVGIQAPLGPRLSVTPGVSYLRYGTGKVWQNREVTYVRADVGLRLRL